MILLHDFEISALSIKRIDHGFELFARLSKLYDGRICEISCLDLEDRSFFIGRRRDVLSPIIDQNEESNPFHHRV